MNDSQVAIWAPNAPISESCFLVTGGAGFIGSTICEYLLTRGAKKVRAFDNLCEGSLRNIEAFLDKPNFEFVQGDIREQRDCEVAMQGVDYVSHQAALGSVPRSVDRPLDSNAANVTGFLNVLDAARQAKVKRFVYASSSSVYGDSAQLPKKEESIGKPLSPYAATKLINEIYAEVFGKTYGMEVIGLRYFNIFGPRQKSDGAYAAVIPLFIKSLKNGEAPYINGDGGQTRDFTYVDNAVQANVLAMFTEVQGATNRAYNIACGDRISINQLYEILAKFAGVSIPPIYRAARTGDVKDSLADISQARQYLSYQPSVDYQHGLLETWKWFSGQTL